MQPEFPQHRVALVFDDGYRASCEQVASLFEARGLRACFAIIAEPEHRFGQVCLDWSAVAELAERGHRIDPHGLRHDKKSVMAFDQATHQIDRCLKVFEAKLPGFDAASAVFHYPYNSATPALNEWLLRRVRAVRVGGSGLNTIDDLDRGVWHCTAYGPNGCDEHLMACVQRLREQPEPTTLLYNLHGVEGEGWGPVTLQTLQTLLNQLRDDNDVSYWNLEAS